MIGYLAIFGCALSGYSGLGIWAIAASSLALAALSQAEYGLLYKRARDGGHFGVAQSTSMHSLSNALLASSGAYAAGFALQLL